MDSLRDKPCGCGGNCGLTFIARGGFGFSKRKYADNCPVMKEKARLRKRRTTNAWRDRKRSTGELNLLNQRYYYTQRAKLSE